MRALLLSLFVLLGGCSVLVGNKLDEKGDDDDSGDDDDDCASNDDCNDDDVCNGRETCDPENEDADSQGCLEGTPLAEKTACDLDGNGDTEDGICLEESCEETTCGDRVVDERTEECDDGNDTARDGCEPDTCVFTCNLVTDCLDTDDICDGPDLCEDHRCVPDTTIPIPPEGRACETEENQAGSCMGGDCVVSD